MAQHTFEDHRHIVTVHLGLELFVSFAGDLSTAQCFIWHSRHTSVGIRSGRMDQRTNGPLSHYSLTHSSSFGQR